MPGRIPGGQHPGGERTVRRRRGEQQRAPGGVRQQRKPGAAAIPHILQLPSMSDFPEDST